MVKPEQTSTPSGFLPTPTPLSFHQSLPSPSLCCACGLCIMLAGINVTLVGVLAFGTGNITIIVGPLLLLVATAFFVACCVASRSRAHMAKGGKRGEKWGLMQMGTVAFEMEMSEHTLQDTTAVQLSPTNSPSSSHKSNSSRGSGSPAWGWDRQAHNSMSDLDSSSVSHDSSSETSLDSSDCDYFKESSLLNLFSFYQLLRVAHKCAGRKGHSGQLLSKRQEFFWEWFPVDVWIWCS